MPASNIKERRRLRALPRPDLEARQLGCLNACLAAILPANALYARKLAGTKLPLGSLEGLHDLPYTAKEELLTPSGLAGNLTFARDRYVRFHRTSGTRGKPLVVLDTAKDWCWWMECWQHVFDAAEVEPSDCVFLAFSFGPFIGFWSAYDAACQRGCLVVPGGGLDTLSRLELMRDAQATVVCCTPSYALHLAEVARQRQFDLAGLPVHTLVVAGEPGGSIPAVRQRIESAWQARVLDHSGASEVGPWGLSDPGQRGVFVNEAEFIAEFANLSDGQPAQPGELCELVLTNLGRIGCPVVRYRTGDVVRPRWPDAGECRFVLLEGGVLGRTDDMSIVRGVNVFPSAVDEILRSFPEVDEYRAVLRTEAALDQLTIEIEDRLNEPQRVAEALRSRLGLRVEVRCAPAGSLPRYEGKGCRFVDERAAP